MVVPSLLQLTLAATPHFFDQIQTMHKSQMGVAFTAICVLFTAYFIHKKQMVEEEQKLAEETIKEAQNHSRKNKNPKKKEKTPKKKQGEPLSLLRKNNVAYGPKGWFDYLLIVLALSAILSYYNFGKFHGTRTFIHIWDFFHYYIGAKYSPELGYSNIYNCVIAAEIVDAKQIEKAIQEHNKEIKKYKKTNPEHVKKLFNNQKQLHQYQSTLRKIDLNRQYFRNLDSYQLKSATIMRKEYQQYADLFSLERWKAFRKDLWFFRSQVQPIKWGEILRDHGYNPSPVWNTTGYLLSNLGRAQDKGHIRFLLALDPLLLLIAALALYFTFGFRTALLAFTLFGVNHASALFWNGGGFLRQGWLAFSVLGICCLKKKKYIWAAFFFSYAAMIRVFPVLFIAGLGMKMVGTFFRTKTIPKRYQQFFVSFTLFCCLWIGYGCLGGLGVANWKFFVEKVKLHNKQNLTNNMGLKPVLLYEGETNFKHIKTEQISDPLIRAFDPFIAWEKSRQEKFSRWKIPFYGFFAFVLLLFTYIVQKKNDLEASILGITLMFIGLNLTCYYYSMLSLFLVIFNKKDRLSTSLYATIQVSFLFLVQFVSILLYYYFQTKFFIAIYFYISLMLLCFIFAIYSHEIFVLQQRKKALVS